MPWFLSYKTCKSCLQEVDVEWEECPCCKSRDLVKKMSVFYMIGYILMLILMRFIIELLIWSFS